MRKISLLSLPVSLSPSIATTLSAMSDALTRKAGMFVTFINPHAFYVGALDQGYTNCLWHFDLVLADGIGVSKATRWIAGQSIARQSFDNTSLFKPVLSHLENERYSLAVIGGEPGVADKAVGKMRSAFPNVHYLGAKDGFHDFEELLNWTAAVQPDVVLIGMGVPIQEKFLLRLKQSGYRGLAITCGGFLDQYIEKDNYYPIFIDNLNLRFVYRLFKEPRRLARRYLIEYQTFIVDAVQTLFRQKLFGR